MTISGCFIPNTNTYQDEPSKGCVSSHSLSLIFAELEPFQKSHTWSPPTLFWYYQCAHPQITCCNTNYNIQGNP